MLVVMKKFQALGTIIFLLAGITSAENQPSTGFFPFSKGRYWLYDGNVQYAKGGEVKEKKITGWKSEVVDTIEGKDFKASLLKGCPQDLSWYEEGKQRGDNIFILNSNKELHHIYGGDDIVKKFAEIKATGALPAGLIDSESILFKTTMKEGDRFGDPEQTKRGPRYCWTVEKISTGKLEHPARGIPADKEFTTGTLIFRTSPDTTILGFSQDLGITSYAYTHHGTKGDCEMRLVETGDDPDRIASKEKSSIKTKKPTPEYDLDSMKIERRHPDFAPILAVLQTEIEKQVGEPVNLEIDAYIFDGWAKAGAKISTRSGKDPIRQKTAYYFELDFTAVLRKIDGRWKCLKHVVAGDISASIEIPNEFPEVPEQLFPRLSPGITGVDNGESTDHVNDKTLERVALIDGESNLRVGPGTSFAAKFQPAKGTIGTVMERKAKWVRIQLANGDSGWVHQSNLRQVR
jgi:hypothetical protein